MEEAVGDEHLHLHGDEPLDEPLAYRRGEALGGVLQPEPLGSLHRQDAGGGVVPEHLRDHEPLPPGEVAPEAVHRAALLGEVEFAERVAPELGKELHEVRPLRAAWREPGEPPDETAEHGHVGAHPLADAGALHLDGDALAARKDGEVDLRQRGRRHGFGIERAERRLHAAAELALDDGADLGEGERWHALLEHFECGDVLGGEHVGPGAEDLAELDERRSQVEQRGHEPLGHVEPCGPLPRAQPDEAAVGAELPEGRPHDGK